MQHGTIKKSLDSIKSIHLFYGYIPQSINHTEGTVNITSIDITSHHCRKMSEHTNDLTSAVFPYAGLCKKNKKKQNKSTDCEQLFPGHNSCRTFSSLSFVGMFAESGGVFSFPSITTMSSSFNGLPSIGFPSPLVSEDLLKSGCNWLPCFVGFFCSFFLPAAIYRQGKIRLAH